jgi:hypothetical protein
MDANVAMCCDFSGRVVVIHSICLQCNQIGFDNNACEVRYLSSCRVSASSNIYPAVRNAGLSESENGNTRECA